MRGEFDLIGRHFARPSRPGRALLGVGDDCALLAPARGALAVSTDMLLEGRHFFPEVDPQSLGHKALAVNLSDLAAMGAHPVAFTLALALPKADDDWLSRFAQGLFALADEHGCELVGGDTTRGPLTMCLTVMGEVDPACALRRSGACAADDLWVSGTLGGAAWAVEHRQATGGWVRPESVTPAAFDDALTHLHRPSPRVALGEALLGVASAAIDLSDGLAGDLGHVLARSSQVCGHGLEAHIDLDRLPLHPVLSGLPPEHQWRLALAGGDDYELLFCAPVAARQALQDMALRPGPGLTRIGRIVAAQEEAPRVRATVARAPVQSPVRAEAEQATGLPRGAGALRFFNGQGGEIALTLQAHDHFSGHASRID